MKMNNTVSITYQLQTFFKEETFYEHYNFVNNIENDNVIYETEEERNAAKTQQKEWTNKARKMFKKVLEKSNGEISIYTFNENTIRYERIKNKISSNEIILIEASTGVQRHFFTLDNGEIKCNEIKLFPNHSDWKVSYNTKTFRNVTKNILGYECFKITVIEQRICEKDKFETTHKHEIYVTDKLNLSASIVMGLWQNIIPFCALEIHTTNEKNIASSILKAIEIKKDVSKERIALPNVYKTFLKK